MPEFTRIMFEMGGRARTRWAPSGSVTADPRDGTTFVDAETGCRKSLNAAVPTVVTHGVPLPPDVDDAEVLEA